MKAKKAKKSKKRVSHLSAAQKTTIYTPAAKLAWVTIYANRAKETKNATERKELLAKSKAQLASLRPTDRAAFNARKAA